MEEEWTIISKPKRLPKSERPVFLDEETAKDLQQNLKIAYLMETLLSNESRQLQKEGWKYNRVLKGDDPDFNQLRVDPTFEVLGTGNKWGDLVLFSRAT